MMALTKEQIRKALPKIKKGLDQYLWIQSEVVKRDVSKDQEFQRKFNYFYRITPYRNRDWQKEFYSLLQENKCREISFEAILSNLRKKTDRLEASFSSKLKATITPEMPVIDSVVLKNLGLRLPYSYQADRELRIHEVYEKLVTEFSRFLKTKNGAYLVSEFKKEYPDTNVSKVKMLDLVLWQTRE